MTRHCSVNEPALTLRMLPEKSIIGNNPSSSMRSRCNRGGRGVRKVKKESEIRERGGSSHFSHFSRPPFPFLLHLLRRLPLPPYVGVSGLDSEGR